MLWERYGLVKGIGFDHGRRVGSVLPAVKVYNARDVDELVLLDVAATTMDGNIRVDEIERLASECNVPLAVGGGIRSKADVFAVLQAGADKVVINSTSYVDPEFVTDSAKSFGSQCIVASVDYRMLNGIPVCFSKAGRKRETRDAFSWSKTLAELGAGEILLTNCDRDGTMSGYDIEILREVSESVDLPVIAAGGAGKASDFTEAILRGGASAVAAGSIFHFTEVTPAEIKARLAADGVPVRIR